MRKSTVIATFLVVGAGATGAGALSFKGSDTLFDFTNDEIAACNADPTNPGGCSTLTYLGTGSGNGETGMKNGTQSIAPMSRFLGNAVCTSDAAVLGPSGLTTAEGLVVGLDGVGVFGSTTQAGQTACNGATATDCSKQPGSGLAFDTTIAVGSGTYTFASWRDVLAVIYGGKTHDGVTDCNSAVRRSIAQNWAAAFESNTCLVAGAVVNGDGNGPQLQHAFRRDDGSGTSDVFASVLGLSPSVAAPQASNFNQGVSPYCNVSQNKKLSDASAVAINGTTQQITVNAPGHGLVNNQWINIYYSGPVAWSTAPTTAKAVSGGVQVTVVDANHFTYFNQAGLAAPTTSNATGGLYFTLPTGVALGIVSTDHQDNDPIRRNCTGTSASPTAATPSEDVCDIGGHLGLVLPIVPVDFLPSVNDQYPSNFCLGAQLIHGNPPRFHNPSNGAIISGGQCPNGHKLVAGTLCIYDSSVGTAGTAPLNSCLERKTGFLEQAYGAYPANVNGGVTSSTNVDPRFWNSQLGKSFATQSANPAVVTAYYQNDLLNRDIQGAWYRIHSNHTLIPSGATASNLCKQNDATRQIGCLVGASPLSIGYAGREADQSAGNVALLVQGIADLTQCIQLFGQVDGVAGSDGGLQLPYLFSRKLYLDTLVGFNQVLDHPGQEDLAKFESVNVNTALTNRNFVTLPSSGPNNVNGGLPFCEDFNEIMLCGASNPFVSTDGGNQNACAANTSPYPTASTTCGNGIREALEECDCGDGTVTSSDPRCVAAGANGAKNGSAPNLCSVTCRLN